MYGWDYPLLTFCYPGFDCGSGDLCNQKGNLGTFGFDAEAAG